MTTTTTGNGAMVRATETSERAVSVGEGGLRLSTMSEMRTFARAAKESGLLPDIKSEAAAIIKIAYGAELGISPMASLLGIYSVEGRPALAASLIAAKIKGSGHADYDVEHHDANRCTLVFYAVEGGKRRKLGPSTFTIEDARAADLANKANWKRYPRNMLFSRAISNGARWYCPEVFFGAVYSVDELRDGDVDVVDVEVVQHTAEAMEVSGIAHEEPTPVSDDEVRLLVRDIGDSKSREDALSMAERFRGRDIADEQRRSISDALNARWPKNAKPAPAPRTEKPTHNAETTSSALSSFARAYVELLDAARTEEQLWSVMSKGHERVEALSRDERDMLSAYERYRLAMIVDEEPMLDDASNGDGFSANTNRLLALLGRPSLPATTGEVLS